MKLSKNFLLKIGFLITSFSIIHVALADESKVALVIGNAKYKDAPLKNPVNDAKDMKDALEKAGFKVIYAENADMDKTDEVRDKFVNALTANTTALFYYSGHGVQADGVNYLIPINAKITSKADLKRRAYDAGIFLDEMEEAKNPVNIVILDACRNNPYKSIRAISGGLTQTSAPKGSIIAYATAPNSVADDNGKGRNGLYTKYLKQYLFEKGATIETALKKVRQAVLEENPDQVPWENSSLIGEVCLAGCGTLPVISPPKTSYAPLISFVSGADSVNQNKSYTVKFKATDDDGDLSKILVDWGDGSKTTSKTAKQGATVSFSYTYKFAGIYDLIATAIDKENNESETFEKSVEVKAVAAIPVPPVATTPTNSAPTVKKLSSSTAVAGQTYTLQLQANDADKNLSLLTIDWGDGASNYENVSGSSSTVSLSHIYANSASFTWNATVYDSNDATGTKSETLNVTQPVVPVPTISNAKASPSSVTSGNAITFSATISDTLPSGYSVKIDYGNGLVSMSGNGKDYSVSATPIKLGAQTFKVGVYDNSGNLKSNQLTGDFEVKQALPANVAPTLSFISGNTSATTNSNYSVQLQASDSDNNLSSITINWGDRTSDSKTATNNTTITFSHTYSSETTYSWSATAYDAGLLNSNTISKNVTVSKPVVVVILPVIDKVSASPSSITTGNAITFSAILSDTLPSGYSVKVDYGNGLVSLSGSSKDYSVSATPIKIGAQTFKIGVYDNIGNLKSSQLTGNFEVKQVPPVNVAPTLSFISGNTSAITNTAYSVQLQASDSDNNLSSISLNWGDGAMDSKTATNNTTLTFTHIYTNEMTYNWSATAYDSDSLSSNTVSKNVVVSKPVVIVPVTPVETPTTSTKGDVETFVSGDRTFSYTKIANDGSELPKTAKLGTAPKDWACTKDNNTGLIWEVKTDDGGLRDRNKTYTNYDKDYPKCNDSAMGWDAGSCKNSGFNSSFGDSTNTDGFVTAVNAQGLCGQKDWRLPTNAELKGLVVCSDGKYKTLATGEKGFICLVNDEYYTSGLSTSTHANYNTTYFPNTLQNDGFWSSSPDAGSGVNAWFVYFYSGYNGANNKLTYDYVRLVRGGQ